MPNVFLEIQPSFGSHFSRVTFSWSGGTRAQSNEPAFRPSSSFCCAVSSPARMVISTASRYARCSPL
jgi:hypothetical protein